MAGWMGNTDCSKSLTIRGRHSLTGCLTADEMAIVQQHRGPIQIARDCVFGYIDSVYAYRRKKD